MIRTENGHLALLFMNASPITKNVEDNFFVENDDEENEESVFFSEGSPEEEKYNKIKKIHNVLCHPKSEILRNFFIDS